MGHYQKRRSYVQKTVWASTRKMKIKTGTRLEIQQDRRRVNKDRVVPAHTVKVYRGVEVELNSLGFALGRSE
jgi:hypothetical protein